MAKAAVSNIEQGIPNRALGFVTRSRDFLRDVRAEMRKVVTPSWKEVQSTTTVVVISVFIFAGFFWIVDAVLNFAITHLYHSLGAIQ
jgi:preprotein translocase subunit SecE